MLGFGDHSPILKLKKDLPDTSEQQGLIQLPWSESGFLATYYTRLDQAFIVWGAAIAIIFLTAQFAVVDWAYQAIVWSVLSLIAIAITNGLAWGWAEAKQVRWLVFVWSGLLGTGILLTDYGVFTSYSPILLHLCPLWLGLSAIGYCITGWGMRSRAQILVGCLHWVAICFLGQVMAWQFLFTGAVMVGSLCFLAELEWDHR